MEKNWERKKDVAENKKSFKSNRIVEYSRIEQNVVEQRIVESSGMT